MKVRVASDAPAFHKELFDIADLFLQGVERLADSARGEDLLITLREQHTGSDHSARAELSGLFSAAGSQACEAGGDALGVKRLRKRCLKLALFDAFCQATGAHPPWGALTGIRPTRLLLDAVAQGRTLPEAAQWMQDTFLLSKDKARLLLDIASLQQGLPPPASCEIGVYIGIPFCKSRCRYCSFISREAGDGSLLAPYTRALIGEIRGTIALMRARGLRARTVYIGGGTPTVLPEGLLADVLDAARPLIMEAVETTVEAGRPDTITPGKLSIIREGGAKRISVNPQTLHDHTLLSVGRSHTARQAVEAFHLAREAGFQHINMDLIAGLPGEAPELFAQSLCGVLSLAPEAITVHTLSLKRSSDMHRFTDPLPDARAVGEMVAFAREKTAASGYAPYYLYRQKHMAGNLENVGYARPGFACLYNLDMMEDRATVLAAGAGSVSKWVSPDGRRILRAPNVKDIDQYIARAGEMLERKNALLEGVGKGVRPPETDAPGED